MMSSKYIKTNLNYHVKVKLTDYGIELLANKHAENRRLYPRVKHYQQPFKMPKTDEDGYTIYQMWSLMETFGNHIGLCCDNPFDLNVLIEVIDDE